MRIEIQLKVAMREYARRSGKRLTYEELSARTGLARSTIESIASRPRYNASLRTLEKICDALGCDVGDLLVSR